MKKLLNISVIGASHIRHDKPCQDFGSVRKGDGYLIFATADGHGDSNCTRSHIGSEIAVNSCLEALEIFYQDMRDHQLESVLEEDSIQRDDYIKHLILSVVSNWHNQVLAHFKESPLTQEERELCSEHYLSLHDQGERIEHLYGTTLIAGLMTDNYLLLLQQGDGRCVVFDSLGNPSQPIPWDDRCFANVTTSLCDRDAIESVRYHLINLKETDVVACFAGSDGVEDSFANMDLLHAYYRSKLLYCAEQGIEKLQEELSESLPLLSQTGSDDDITITGFIDEEAILPLVETFEKENQIVQLMSQLSEVDKRLESIKSMGKIDILKQKLSMVDSEIKSVLSARNKFQQENANWVELTKELVNNEQTSYFESSFLVLKKSFGKWFSKGLGIAELDSRSKNYTNQLEEELGHIEEEIKQLELKKQKIKEEYGQHNENLRLLEAEAKNSSMMAIYEKLSVIFNSFWNSESTFEELKKSSEMKYHELEQQLLVFDSSLDELSKKRQVLEEQFNDSKNRLSFYEDEKTKLQEQIDNLSN